MRGSFAATLRATAKEILSEPLSLLLTMAALAISALAPAFHYHQFGDPTRMARDAGLSAHFLCGTLFAVFGILLSLRREVESGTVQMALAHPVSRPGFFIAKVCGALVAQTVFAVIVSLTMVTIVKGAVIGGALAQKTGDVARLWGPSLAIGVATLVLPLLFAAALNAWWHWRFVQTALSTMSLCAVIGVFIFPALTFPVLRLMLPLCVLMFVLTSVFLTASAAFAVRFRANMAVAAVGIVLLSFVPAVGNYYLSDALTKGSRVSWNYVGWAVLTAVPALAAFLILGIRFFSDTDVANRE